MFPEDLNRTKNCFFPDIDYNYHKIMAGETTRSITADYIRHRLHTNYNYRWENGSDVTITPTDTQKAMRELGKEFEDKFRTRFETMIQQLSINRENVQETFDAIVHEIFDDGVNWGRVVALYGFAAKFCVLCVQKNMADMIDHIVEWVTAYVDNNLSDWMLSNDGWQGFLTFHNGPESKKDSGWPNIRTIGGYALAGLGMITLGAFLTQRS